MKKLAVIILGLSLLCCAFTVGAEESGNFQTEMEKNYISTMYLTKDTYGEVCITPYYLSELYGKVKKDNPRFVRFAFPENTRCLDFNMNSCSLLDAGNACVYTYQSLTISELNTESFLKGRENVIKNTDQNYAVACVEQEKGSARALISLTYKENQKTVMENAYLYVSILLINFEDMEDEGIKTDEKLKEAITNEVDRIQKELQKEGAFTKKDEDGYWKTGAFEKVQLASMSIDGRMLTFNLKSVNSDNQFSKRQLFPIGGGKESFTCLSLANYNQIAMIVECGIDNISYADYIDAQNTDIKTLEGTDWSYYMLMLSDGKQPYAAYAFRKISETEEGSGETYYLNVRITLDVGEKYWSSEKNLLDDLKVILKNLQIEEEKKTATEQTE